jgi:tetratricopeptide (TPR) repeat protein
MLGSLYETKKDVAAAESYMKKAIELNPNLPSLQILLGGFYMRQHLTDKAKNQYLAAVEKAPDAITALMALGMIYENEKNYSKAQEYYEKALKINPNFVPAANNLAFLYAEHGGNIDVALNLAQKAKEQVPEEAHISDTLGWIYYKKNVPGTAITYLKEAADKMPDEPSVRYHLGMAYYKNGNRDLAKKELSAALKINSGFAGADEARATLNNIK